MLMPGRQYSAPSTSYRYGFNGKENDNKDGVVQYDYGFRIYDPRLVRFKSLDPLQKKFPELTPYQFASNSPIANVDLDGREADYYTTTVTFITTHRQLPNGQFEVSRSQTFSTLHTKTGLTPNGPLGEGTQYVVQTQVAEVFLDVHGYVQSKCEETPRIVQKLYVFSDQEIMKRDITKRPMSQGKLQVLVFGSGSDNSESPGNLINPNAIVKSIDLNAFNELIEPVMLGMDVKKPGAPELNDLLGEIFSQTIDKINQKYSNGEFSKEESDRPSYDPNSKIDPAQHQAWYDGMNQGSSNDTSTHPERKLNRPILITDSNGKPVKEVRPVGKNKSDTIPLKN